ncbi:hypothetical protein ACOTWR_06585 [Aliarcobacter butzleri]|uniref:hypothetical protein n=1 Tax=Aliarcobacter butzleri TaxID=28197 RepID=UPI0021B40260|nr:hypothetical protein [Aliarcobacter butzleri]MCT7564121.1 hypothetical protein [Aliarcobacter butzleri]MCT7578720.1 hypothetical protein [Aliarcobacter butzleri]MCT7647663.1 hypothetical protein [Aliarcobacter butzleri]
MNKLTEDEKDLLDILVKNEIEVIEKGFLISEFMGKLFLSNSISDFKNIHLKAKYGEIIPAMCMEYRYFIIGLLKKIKDEYRDVATREVIVPTIGNIETEKLLKILKEKEENECVL